MEQELWQAPQEQEPPLQVSMLGELMYCARLPYWRLIAMARLPKSALMDEGVRLHREAAARVEQEPARLLRWLGLSGDGEIVETAWERPVAAPGWSGRVDLLVSLADGQVVVVECKRSLRAHPQAAHVQLATYAWMLQAEGLAVHSAWLWDLTRDAWSMVELSPVLIESAARLREILRTWRLNPSFPDVSELRAGMARRELCDLCPCDNLCMDQARPWSDGGDDALLARLNVSAGRRRRTMQGAGLAFF